MISTAPARRRWVVAGSEVATAKTAGGSHQIIDCVSERAPVELTQLVSLRPRRSRFQLVAEVRLELQKPGSMQFERVSLRANTT
jgi:hypothetical protein